MLKYLFIISLISLNFPYALKAQNKTADSYEYCGQCIFYENITTTGKNMKTDKHDADEYFEPIVRVLLSNASVFSSSADGLRNECVEALLELQAPELERILNRYPEYKNANSDQKIQKRNELFAKYFALDVLGENIHLKITKNKYYPYTASFSDLYKAAFGLNKKAEDMKCGKNQKEHIIMTAETYTPKYPNPNASNNTTSNTYQASSTQKNSVPSNSSNEMSIDSFEDSLPAKYCIQCMAVKAKDLKGNALPKYSENPNYYQQYYNQHLPTINVIQYNEIKSSEIDIQIADKALYKTCHKQVADLSARTGEDYQALTGNGIQLIQGIKNTRFTASPFRIKKFFDADPYLCSQSSKYPVRIQSITAYKAEYEQIRAKQEEALRQEEAQRQRNQANAEYWRQRREEGEALRREQDRKDEEFNETLDTFRQLGELIQQTKKKD